MFFFLLACAQPPDSTANRSGTSSSPFSLARAEPSEPAWLAHSATTIRAAFPPPPGTTRAPEDEFGVWLGALPLLPPGTPTHDWQGNPAGLPAARVLAWSITGQSTLQCADSALRLRATWLRSVGQSPAFHYTSGDLSAWSGWAGGTRPRVSGNTVRFVPHAATPDTSDVSFQRWLTDLYMYAGTRSLGFDSSPVTEARAGDIVVAPGSPGHAVVILDVARRDVPGEDPHTYVLVGQGFLPAVEFHVVAGPVHGWYEQSGDVLPVEPLAVPWAGLRRWK